MFIRFRPLLVTALVTSLAACSTLDPYTGEKETAKAGKGTAIGAVAGLIVGAATGDSAKERRKRALIGAGAGALAGGSVGYYMDRQEAKLRQELQGTGVSVSREGDEIVLNMPGNITFQTDSAALNTGFFDVLNSVAAVLDEYDKTLVVVNGFTDSTGAEGYNQQLSERRAASVAEYLGTREVDLDRMLVIGHGEAQPVAPNSSVDGRAQNRRVELTLEPLTQG